MNNLPALITKLREIQQYNSYTNLLMAEKLGCSCQLYRDTKSGKLPVGLTMLKGSVKAFPELITDALIFLTDGADISTYLAVKGTDATEKPHNHHLLRLWSKAVGIFRGRLKPPVN